MKKILLISPFPPAQNPRLLKEYEILKANHFNVKVLYAERDKWASDYKSFENKDFILVGGKYGSPFYYLTRLLHKLLRNVLPTAYGYNRISWLLYLRALSIKADLYLAHNLGALPVAVKAAKKNKAQCGFDAEDLHRHELSDNINTQSYQQAKFLEDKFLAQVDYFTAASPLIATQYQKIYPSLKPTAINNVFSSGFLQKVVDNRKDKELKLFWLSQTIGKGRGLEDVIKSIGILKQSHISLSLLGSIGEDIEIYFLNVAVKAGLSRNQLNFIKPISPDETFELANQYDIGLALEQSTPFNRDICLTNKIFTYLTSGLAVIASETTAQKDFVLANPNIGKSYPIGDINALASIINQYDNDRDLLDQTKLASSALAKEKMNWEMESKKFIKLIEMTLRN
ncbi:hypothetical protein [Pedobacter agri]|uniref:hypothetical protein n=1 Tax=Pedobacter agri TaxID=454586 RepID=UPI002785BDB3|nr:hypothetical protein [Pedobacter agri]MDQ1141878.1 glycosyltransferase involved in cell wall biosynthesis [Pedobacter agri]